MLIKEYQETGLLVQTFPVNSRKYLTRNNLGFYEIWRGTLIVSFVSAFVQGWEHTSMFVAQLVLTSRLPNVKCKVICDKLYHQML